jgi:hypothetical protein
VRKLIVSNIMSLDGYVEGRGGNVMALPMDALFDEHNPERLRGRRHPAAGPSPSSCSQMMFCRAWQPWPGGPAVPGAPAADLMLVQADQALPVWKRSSIRQPQCTHEC